MRAVAAGWWVGAVVLLGSCAAPALTWPAKYRVLTESQSEARGHTYWRPTEDDVAVIENALARAWITRSGVVKEKPVATLENYVVGYFGTIESGRRVIVGRGVHKDELPAGKILGWDQDKDVVVLTAFGGGSHFFRVTYDVAEQRLTEVRFNAAL